MTGSGLRRAYEAGQLFSSLVLAAAETGPTTVTGKPRDRIA